MFPLYDDNPRQLTQYVNWSLMVLCVVVFLWETTLSDSASELAVIGAGLIPARLVGGASLPVDVPALPAWATIFSSMFLHEDWLHLGGNMLYLWIFGDNVEDAMGHWRYLVFYLLCGTAAALTQTFLDPTSTIPMIGASGAISGVLGAYVLLFPRANVRTLVFLVVFVTIMNIPASVVLGLWFLLQLVDAALATPDQPGVAFWAHVGGFVSGMALVFVLRRPGFGLWQAARSQPFDTRRVRGPWE